MTAATHPFLLGAHPVALAHRGGAGEAPENSPATFQRVVDLGYRWIETDVRATIDGHAVVFHDATLDRTTDATGRLSAAPLALVRSTVLADGQHPITLADALARWPQARFNVDVKADDTVEPFLRAVSDADAWDRVCAAAFSSRRLVRLSRLAGPRLAISMGPVEVTRLLLGDRSVFRACAAQVPYRTLGVAVVTRSFVQRAHRRGLHVHVWTINDREAMVELLELGVDGIVTDRPTVLRDVLMERGSWDS